MDADFSNGRDGVSKFGFANLGVEGKARISLSILLRIDNRNYHGVQMDQLEDLLIIF